MGHANLSKESIPPNSQYSFLQRHSTHEEIRESVKVNYWVGSHNPAWTSSGSMFELWTSDGFEWFVVVNFSVPTICCPRSIQATHTHACQNEVSIRLFDLWSPRPFVVASFSVGPMFPCNKKQLSRFPTKKLEVPESGSTLHQLRMMVASFLQKIESSYPRFGLQDIDCDLGCLIYATAASQRRIVQIQLEAGLPAFQLSMFAICEALPKQIKESIPATVCLLAIPGIQSLPAAWGSCEPHCGCIMPIPSLQLQKKDLSHAEKQRVWSRSCGLQESLKFTYPFTDCAPMRLQAFSLRGLEVGLPAFQLPMFAKCDALRNPFSPFVFGFRSIHPLREAWSS